MLAKMTSKNQLTLPKSIVQALGSAEYFDVELRGGQIVLTPVRIQRADAVRAKLAALCLGQGDVADAVRWGRSGQSMPGVAEAPAGYASGTRPSKAGARKKPRRQ